MKTWADPLNEKSSYLDLKQENLKVQNIEATSKVRMRSGTSLTKRSATLVNYNPHFEIVNHSSKAIEQLDYNRTNAAVVTYKFLKDKHFAANQLRKEHFSVTSYIKTGSNSSIARHKNETG